MLYDPSPLKTVWLEDQWGPFAPFLPPQLAALRPADVPTLGAFYGERAAGAAVLYPGEALRLVWIELEAGLRGRGLGERFLAAVLAAARERWGDGPVECRLTRQQLDEEGTDAFFSKAGFTVPAPVSTQFQAALGDIPLPPQSNDFYLTLFTDLPQVQRSALEEGIRRGTIPPFCALNWAANPVPDCCVCAMEDTFLAGCMLTGTWGDGLLIHGIYVLPPYRGRHAASRMFYGAMESAKVLFSPGTEVRAQAGSSEERTFCGHLFRGSAQTLTEAYSMWHQVRRERR